MPPDGHRSEGTLSLSEVPYAGAKPFGLFFAGPAFRRLEKVTRCKSETASGNTRSNGYAPKTRPKKKTRSSRIASFHQSLKQPINYPTPSTPARTIQPTAPPSPAGSAPKPAGWCAPCRLAGRSCWRPWCPATPEDRTCVVDTGRLKMLARPIMLAVVICADMPWAYVMPCLPIFSPMVSTTRFQPTMVPIPSASATARDYPERGVLGGGGQVFAQFVEVGFLTGIQAWQLATFFAVSSRHSR